MHVCYLTEEILGSLILADCIFVNRNMKKWWQNKNRRNWSQIQSCFKQQTHWRPFKCPWMPHSLSSSSSVYLTRSILSVKRLGLSTALCGVCLYMCKLNYLYTRSTAFSSPGLLVEPLKVKGGVVKQRVLHLHFPRLQMDRERAKVHHHVSSARVMTV